VDSRLPPEALVIGIAAAGEQVAYPLTDRQGRYPARPRAVTVTHLGSQRLVILSDPAAHAAAVYQPEAKQQSLTLAVQEDSAPPQWRDHQTGSTWNLQGQCVAGPLKGEALAPANFVRVRWYAWSAVYPKTALMPSRP